jgi:hypothetical protein
MPSALYCVLQDTRRISAKSSISSSFLSSPLLSRLRVQRCLGRPPSPRPIAAWLPACLLATRQRCVCCVVFAAPCLLYVCCAVLAVCRAVCRAVCSMFAASCLPCVLAVHYSISSRVGTNGLHRWFARADELSSCHVLSCPVLSCPARSCTQLGSTQLMLPPRPSLSPPTSNSTHARTERETTPPSLPEPFKPSTSRCRSFLLHSHTLLRN